MWMKFYSLIVWFVARQFTNLFTISSISLKRTIFSRKTIRCSLSHSCCSSSSFGFVGGTGSCSGCDRLSSASLVDFGTKFSLVFPIVSTWWRFRSAAGASGTGSPRTPARAAAAGCSWTPSGCVCWSPNTRTWTPSATAAEKPWTSSRSGDPQTGRRCGPLRGASRRRSATSTTARRSQATATAHAAASPRIHAAQPPASASGRAAPGAASGGGTAAAGAGCPARTSSSRRSTAGTGR